jgi:hypothetical protein
MLKTFRKRKDAGIRAISPVPASRWLKEKFLISQSLKRWKMEIERLKKAAGTESVRCGFVNKSCQMLPVSRHTTPWVKTVAAAPGHID